MQETWVRKIPWRRKWQPTPAFLPGESHGQRSLVGYSPWGCKASDTTELVMIIYDIVHRKMWNSVNPVVEYSWEKTNEAVSRVHGAPILRHMSRACCLVCLFLGNRADFKCCVSFWCAAKWPGYTYTHILFNYGLSQHIENSSLCWTVGPCCRLILHM